MHDTEVRFIRINVHIVLTCAGGARRAYHGGEREGGAEAQVIYSAGMDVLPPATRI